jgi:hypothetical protein
MLIKISAIDGTQLESPLAHFTSIAELNQWLKNPRLPRYYQCPEWCWDDLTPILSDGGHAVLGGAFYSVGSGLQDWASFHLDVDFLQKEG